MRLCPVRHWRIATRILLIMVVPVLLTFVSLTGWLIWSRDAEIQRDLQERARMLATALAARSEYSLMSGDLSEVEHTVRSLLQVDKTVYQVAIVDAQGRPLLQLTDATLASDKLQVAEVPIEQEWAAVSSFGVHDPPHESAAENHSELPLRHVAKLGAVRVTLSPTSMEAHKRRRLGIGTAIASGFFLLSIAFGLLLARGLTRPLATTLAMIRRIRAGDFEVTSKGAAGGEVGELQACIADMALGLAQFKQELEDKVRERTLALQAARDEAVRSNDEKRRLIQKIDSIIEQERKKLAADIHDQLNATLIVVRLEAQRITHLAARTDGVDIRNEVRSGADAIASQVSSLYDAARRLVKRLRPEVIDTLGLRGAVEDMVRQLDALHPYCRFGLHAAGDIAGLHGEIAMCAYRLIQEAVSNAVKYSGANAIAIRIEVGEPNGKLDICVADNGCGFDVANVARGTGLIGMRERVDGWGGSLTIESRLHGGTAIAITLPVQPHAQAASIAPDESSRTAW